MNNEEITRKYVRELINVKESWLSFTSIFGGSRTKMFTLEQTLAQVENELNLNEDLTIENVDEVFKNKLKEKGLIDELANYPENNKEINDVINKCFVRKLNYELKEVFKNDEFAYKVLDSLKHEVIATSMTFNGRTNIMEYFADSVAISYRENNVGDTYIYKFLTNLDLVLSKLEKDEFKYHEIRTRLEIYIKIYLDTYELEDIPSLIDIVSDIEKVKAEKDIKRLSK